MIKSRAIPRRRVMALLARLREAALNMVGIGCSLEIFQVARDAGRDSDVVVVGYVTVNALAWRNCV